jgi:phosphomannomutase
MRPTGPDLVAAFIDGVTAAGAGRCEHRAVFNRWLVFCFWANLDIPGAMFTASHNPAEYNGIKLCRAGAAPVGQDSGLVADSRIFLESENLAEAYDGPFGSASSARHVGSRTRSTYAS